MPAVCVLLYNGLLSSHCEQDIKEYCKTQMCRRETLFTQFDEQPKKVMPEHDCCDNCAAKCSCGSQDCGEVFRLEISDSVEVPGSSEMKTRPQQFPGKYCQ